MEQWKGLWRYVLGVVACAVIGFFPFVQQTRVPLLGLVDLGFHELGHMLTLPLPDVATAIMGSVMQVAVPLGLVAYFSFARRDFLGAGLCLAWAGASAWDVGVYIADAPYQRLSLIGGEHDWAFLLGPGGFGDLSAAEPLSTAMTILGAALILAGIGVCFAAPLLYRTRTSLPANSGTVREPRQWVERELTSGLSAPELSPGPHAAAGRPPRRSYGLRSAP